MGPAGSPIRCQGVEGRDAQVGIYRADLADRIRAVLAGKKVLLADDVRTTGKTFSHCAELVRRGSTA